MKIKNKKYLAMVIGSIGLVSILFGTTYSWFTYQREGNKQELIAGDIYLNLNEDDGEIELSNIFPETVTEARNRNDNFITFSVDGLNTSNKTIYYEFILNHGTDKESPKTRYRDEDLRFDLVELDSNGEEVDYLISGGSFDTLTNKRIWVDTVDANTTTELVRRYKLRMWLDENVIISDSDPKATYNTTEYKNKYATVKLTVAGDFNEKHIDYLYNIMKRQAVMDNINSDYVDNTTPGINFGAISSDTNGKGVYMRAGTENDDYPIMYYRGAVEDNNVIFGDYCWKAVRTTDTGGVKLIYNGEQVNNNGTIVCNNTGSTTGIEIDNVSMFPFSGNNLYQSLAYNGYMWGSVYNWGNQTIDSTHYFGSDITYNNGEYSLVNAEEGYANSRHYTCSMANSNGTCENIKYYYYGNNYLILTNGDKIEDAIRKMQTNTVSSFAKQKIDSWYSTNMSTFTNKLEDTVWCNDRSMKTNTNGWIAGGGDITENLLYAANGRINSSNTPSLNCTNRNDAFTVKNDKGNQALTYPTALLTADEIVLAGGAYGNGTNSYLRSGVTYWTMTPSDYEDNYASNFFLGDNYLSSSGYSVSTTSYLRPAISLKPGTSVVSGTGTVADPFVIG